MAVAYNIRFDSAVEDDESKPYATLPSTDGVLKQYPEPKKSKLRFFPTTFAQDMCSFQAASAPAAFQEPMVDVLNPTNDQRSCRCLSTS
jgi:hypothetical protein